MNTLNGNETRRQRAGGVSALYLALAYIAAMPYFLLVVDYPGATTVADKVALIIENYASMYAMYVATYMIFGLALGVLVFALYDRLRTAAPSMARIAAAVGLLWSVALVTSGMIQTYGMTTIVNLAETDRAGALLTWQAIEPIALALGGAGGEFLGGVWVLIVSWVALRGRALPKALGWLGVAVGALGLISIVPPLHDAAYAFGMLQIAWFVWLGVTLTRTKTQTAQANQPADARATRGVVASPA